VQRRIDRRLGELTDRVSAPVSLGVLRVRDLPKLPLTLFNYELRYGRRVLWGGDPSETLPAYDPAQMPLIEATRLLLNRGVLLWGDALRVRQSPPHGAEAAAIIRRNRKAVVGIGDALLIAAGCFHWSYCNRMERASRCQLFDRFESFDFRHLYLELVRAKLGQDSSKLDGGELPIGTPEILALHEQVLRQVEESRLERSISDWARYAASDLSYPRWLRRGGAKRLARLMLRFGPPSGNGFFRRHWRQETEEILLLAFPYLAYRQPDSAFVRGAVNWRSGGEPDPLAVWRQFRQLWREAR
jgi:hypothetical protein